MPYRLNNMNAPDIPGHFFYLFLKKCFEKFGELKKTPYLCTCLQEQGRLAQLV